MGLRADPNPFLAPYLLSTDLVPVPVGNSAVCLAGEQSPPRTGLVGGDRLSQQALRLEPSHSE